MPCPREAISGILRILELGEPESGILKNILVTGRGRRVSAQCATPSSAWAPRDPQRCCVHQLSSWEAAGLGEGLTGELLAVGHQASHSRNKIVLSLSAHARTGSPDCYEGAACSLPNKKGSTACWPVSNNKGQQLLKQFDFSVTFFVYWFCSF